MDVEKALMFTSSMKPEFVLIRSRSASIFSTVGFAVCVEAVGEGKQGGMYN